ncbi:MAG: helix-turn-helix transcriptional regulator [Clostridiales bacterium]|nr:helix-turn-helix transcriptional regulator [Clostridiales bacterium]
MENLNPKICHRLRQLRKERGFTQQQIANVLGINRSTYSYYETGFTSPDIPTLLILVKIFHVTLEEFFQFDANENTEKKNCSTDLQKKEQQIICYYRTLPQTKQSELLEFAEFLAQQNKKERAQDAE